ncbi:hypothetical protein HY230_10870 [Candidatus Acetothermia bacterium]|nr:hypothetical protein [Candidatus Acetothermia bacterium]
MKKALQLSFFRKYISIQGMKNKGNETLKGKEKRMPLSIQQVHKIVELFAQASVSEMQIEDSSGSLRLTKQSPVITHYETAKEEHYKVCSPYIGQFFPKVHRGQQVNTHTIVGVIKMLGIEMEIFPQRPGVISHVFVDVGQIVDYGHPLMDIASSS